jgi:hypothetical protein
MRITNGAESANPTPPIPLQTQQVVTTRKLPSFRSAIQPLKCQHGTHFKNTSGASRRVAKATTEARLGTKRRGNAAPTPLQDEKLTLLLMIRA